VTINSTAAASGPYTGTGVLQTLPFDFHAASKDEVRVEVDGAQVFGFDVVLEDDGTGSVIGSFTINSTIYIASDPSFAQETDFSRFAPYFPDSLNPPLDRAAIRDIALLAMLKRAMVAPLGYTDAVAYFRAIGFRGDKGNPGSNTSDVGLFAEIAQMTIPAVAMTVRVSDRNKAIVNRYTGGVNLAAVAPAGEGKWWTRDSAGQFFVVDASNGLPLASLGVTPSMADIYPQMDQARAYCAFFGVSRILLPIGVFKYSTQFRPALGLSKGVSLIGPGSGLCVFERTATNNGCFLLEGDGAEFSGFTIRDTVTTVRGNAAIQGHGVCVYLATNFKVDDVLVDGGAGAGILTLGSQRGTITRCRVMGVKADGIHTTGGFGDRASTDISVWGCYVANCGDDHYPVVSYQIDGARCARISFSQCYSFGGGARAFVSAGGDDITYQSCVAVNPALAGLAAITDGTNGGLHGNTRVTFDNCTVINGGSPNVLDSYGAMHVFALGGADAVTITFRNCNVSGSRNEGLHAYSSQGGTIRGLTVEGGNIAGCFYAGIWAVDVIDQRIEGVRIQQTRGEALLIENAKGNLRVLNNEWEAAGTAGTAECTITDGGLNGARQIWGNTSRIGVRLPEGGVVTPSSDFIVALIDGLDYGGNYAEDGKLPKFGAAGNEKQMRRAAALADNTATANDAAGAAPTAAEFNALHAMVTSLQTTVNTLLANRRAAGEQGL